MRELTFKERLFVEAYIGSAAGNATEAARKAGYAWPEKVGSRLVGRSGIKAAIGARVESAAISANEVLARVSDIATADITEFLEFDDKGGWTVNLVLVKRRRKGHLIRKVKSNEHGTEIELEAKLQALIKLGEYHGMWDREKPPEISLVELAKRLKEKYERIRSMDDTDGSSGSDPELATLVQ